MARVAVWKRDSSKEGVRSGRVSLPPGDAQRTKILASLPNSFFRGKKKEEEKYAREIINHRSRRILREIRGVECHPLGLERVRRVRRYPIFEEHARHVP